MTPTHLRVARCAAPARIAATVVASAALALGTVACRTAPRRTPRPPSDAAVRAELAPDFEGVPLRSPPPELGPYLEAFPLGTLGRRKDLLAADPLRSMHLVQLALPLPAHTHPRRREIAYVLRGRGTVLIAGRSYPAAPGATFNIAPGVAHTVLPDEGETLVAIAYYEPPLLEGDDSVPAR